MKILPLFILTETLARTPAYVTRDWTQAEMAQWNKLCTDIAGLKGNGSGFIEKLHRGKSLTHLRELINNEKIRPNYEDDYSGEDEEIEEILFDGPSDDYMLNDIDSSYESYDMKLPYQNIEEYLIVSDNFVILFYRSIEPEKVSEERDPRTVAMTPTTTVPATRSSILSTDAKTEKPHLTPQEIRQNRKAARDECKTNFAANTVERKECIEEVNARGDSR